MASFRKRNGKWQVQVRKANFVKTATFASKREAVMWAAEVELLSKSVSITGVQSVPRDATLDDLIKKYMNDVEIAGRTKKATLLRWSNRFGDVRLANLDASVMRNFIDSRVADGAGGVTIAQDLSYLSTVLHWARFSRNLDVDPKLALDARASLQHRKINTRGTERTRLPTQEELDRLFAFWNNNKLMILDMPTICRFLLATSMRLSEACGLKVEDVDRDHHTVWIRKRKDPRKKDTNDQQVPLLPKAWEIVEPLITDRTKGQVFLGANPRSVSAAFTRACKKVIPPIIDLHAHDLRHAAITSFFTEYGVDIPHASLLSGHKTWAQLKRYSNLKPSDVFAKIAKGNQWI